MKTEVAIVWFRNDLRLHDHLALTAATDRAEKIVPVVCIDPRQFSVTAHGFPKTGPFRARFLLESVADLRDNLRAIGGDLAIRIGEPEKIIPALARRLGARAVFTHREIADEERRVTRRLDRVLAAEGILLEEFPGNFLYQPEDIPFASNDVPEVFSQFRKGVEKESSVRPPLPTPLHLECPRFDAGTLPTLGELGLEEPEPEPRTILSFRGGETASLKRLRSYIWEKDLLKNYKKTRNGLLGDYSSKFSPWLAQGCLSAREIHAEVRRYERLRLKNQSTYWLIFELIWRDYFRYAFMRWGNAYFHEHGLTGLSPRRHHDPERLQAWMLGETGIPFVDANMIELRRTGFMSNRGRQNVASFLVKDLKQNWTIGAAWFESMLIDYDVHSNWGNWAYVAGVGNDPRNNRSFSIPKQAWTYDRRGTYVRQWIPELAGLPEDTIHQPHREVAPALAAESIYRKPMVRLRSFEE